MENNSNNKNESLHNIELNEKSPNALAGFFQSEQGKRVLALILTANIAASGALFTGCGEKAVLASEQPTTAQENKDQTASEKTASPSEQQTVTEEIPDQNQDTSEAESTPNEDFYNIERIYPNGIDLLDGWLTPDKNTNFYEGTENIAEYNCFNQLTPEQQSEIKRLESMSTTEFNALDNSEQLKYSYWLIENYRPEFDMYLQLSQDTRRFCKPESAEDLGNYIGYIKCMVESICTTKYDSIANTKSFSYDLKNAEKLVSAIYSDKQFQEIVQEQLPNLGSTTIFQGFIHTKAYSINSDKSISINVDEKILNTTLNGQYRLVEKSFTDIHGFERKVMTIEDGYGDYKEGHTIPELENPRTDVDATIINY